MKLEKFLKLPGQMKDLIKFRLTLKLKQMKWD